MTRRRRRRRRRRAPRWLRRNRKTRDSARRSARPVRAARAWGARASSRAQTATRRRVSSSSSGTRAERTDTREQPPREQRIAGLVGRLHRVVDDIGVFNDELETDFKESEFGALAVVARAMPKKPVESPTSYEDIFERIKFPGYVVVKPAQKELILAAISDALGRDRKCFDANLRGNQRRVQQTRSNLHQTHQDTR